MSVAATSVTNDPAAHELLRGAHETGYRFPEGFAGFAATVSLVQDDSLVSGAARIRASRDIALDIDAAEATQEWIRKELSSIAGHRWPASYDEGDGRYTQTLGPDDDHPLGRLIMMHDDPFSSSYRVRDGRISQVNRQMGSVRFTISLQDHIVVDDGRVLPSHFTVSFWDVAEGRLIRSDTYSDRYRHVAGVYLPVSRRVITAADSEFTARVLLLTGHELLS